MRVATVTVAVFFAALAPATALADNGVHVDPGSPSQHQYVIPVNAARGETHSGGKGSGSGLPLFGAGVKPSSGSSSSSGSSGAGAGATAATAKKHAARLAHPGQKGLNSTYSLASQTHTPGSSSSAGSGGDGGSGWVPLVAGGAAVLLLGGGGGLALRRRLVRT